MIILDGKNYSKKLKNEIKDEVAKLIKQTSVKPGLAIVLVGENPASCIYVRNKMKAAAFCNIVANLIKVEENITQEELCRKMPRLKEIPFESTRKLMTTIHKLGNKYRVITKGAPDFLLKRCTNYLSLIHI